MDIWPTGIFTVQLRFVLSNLFQDEIGKVCRLLLNLFSGLSRTENRVLVVTTGHKLIEHVQIIGINLLQSLLERKAPEGNFPRFRRITPYNILNLFLLVNPAVILKFVII